MESNIFYMYPNEKSQGRQRELPVTGTRLHQLALKLMEGQKLNNSELNYLNPKLIAFKGKPELDQIVFDLRALDSIKTYVVTLKTEPNQPFIVWSIGAAAIRNHFGSPRVHSIKQDDTIKQMILEEWPPYKVSTP